MDKQEVLDALPKKVAALVTIKEHGDKFVLSHKDVSQELYNQVFSVVERFGGKCTSYFDAQYHYEIPKVSSKRTPEASSVEQKKAKKPIPRREAEKTVDSPKQAPPEEIGVRLIGVNSLVESPFWTREFKDDESFRELVESIRDRGVAQNLLARWKDNNLEIVIGHRRWKAAQKVGLGHVPVKIRDLTDEQVLLLQFDENERRKDLADMEKARFLQTMIVRLGYTQEQLAKKLGKKQPWVSRHLAMLSEELRDIIPRGIIQEGELTEGQARELLKVPEEKRAEIIKTVEKTGKVPSMRQMQEIVKPKVCERCNVSSSSVEEWVYQGKPQGIFLCDVHRKDAERNPERYWGRKNSKKTIEKLEKPKPPFKDTWPVRKARMQVPRSKFEELFDEEAAKDGLPSGERNQNVCVQKKNVDRLFETPQGLLFVEFLGPPHEGKEDKDEDKARLLRQQGKLLEFRFKSTTRKKAREAVQQVRVKLEAMGAIQTEERKRGANKQEET